VLAAKSYVSPTRRVISMTRSVRLATASDLAWLVERDKYISPDWMAHCIDHAECWVAEADGELIGWLRYSWFWRAIPYMERIHVLEERRRSGVGTALFRAWEATMRAQGVMLLMTSSTGYELEPQAWHRRNGFVESGRLTFGKLEPEPEVFLVKDL
jgi:GNAT superfamily N-acetyltransferase